MPQGQSIGRFFVTLGGDATGYERALDRMKKGTARTFSAIGASLKRIGSVITIGGAVVTGFFAGALKAAADFGKELSILATIIDQDAGVSLEEIGDGIRKIQVLFHQAEPAIEAAYQAMSRGVEPARVLEFLFEASVAATGGVGDLADVVKGARALMDSFGLGIDETRRVMDIMFTTVKFGGTDIGELGDAVGKGAVVFANAGISIEEFAASIAVVTQTGLKTSETVTALKAGLTNILEPSQAAAELADTLGIAFNREAVAAEGLVPFLQGVLAKIEQLNPVLAAEKRALEALNDPSKEQRNRLRELASVGGSAATTFDKLFGSVEGFTAILTLAGIKGNKVTEIVKDMTDSLAGGETNLEKAFKAAEAANPAKSFDTFKIIMKDLQITIGQKLLPTVNEFLRDSLLPLLDTIGDWIKANPDLTKQIVILTAKVGLALLVFGPLLIILGSLIGILGSVASGFAAVAGGALAMLAAVGKLVTLIGPAGGGAGLTLMAGLLALTGVLALLESFFRDDNSNFISRWVKGFEKIQKAIDFVFDTLFKLWELLKKAGSLIGRVFGGDGLGLSRGFGQGLGAGTLTPATSGLAGGSGSPSGSPISITVNLPGAIIDSEARAIEVGETLSRSLANELRHQFRFTKGAILG